MIEPWLFRLDLPGPALEQLANLLDRHERARAAAFRYNLHRNRFIARRGQLRLLLSRIVDAAPDMLRFGHGNHGKPCLLNGGDIRFNNSSAGPLGLCVVSRGIEVGCDIAQNQPVPDDLNIASRLFSPQEYRGLSCLAGEQRQHAFLTIWTRKEALLKAMGDGLNAPLDTFVISFSAPTETFRSRTGDQWATKPLQVGAAFVAAVAARSGSGDFPMRQASFLEHLD